MNYNILLLKKNAFLGGKYEVLTYETTNDRQ